MNKIDSLIAPKTKEFVKLCRRYFEYLEKLPDSDISGFWPVQLRLLPEIYSGISRLPRIEVRYSSEVEKFVTERDYKKTLKKLTAYVDVLDRFTDFTVQNSHGSMKAVEASLSEMLTDIYQELKDFVLLYETGTIENMNDAIAECQETFGEYWGIRLLSAIRIMHINLYQQRYAASTAVLQMDEEQADGLTGNGEYGDDTE